MNIEQVKVIRQKVIEAMNSTYLASSRESLLAITALENASIFSEILWKYIKGDSNHKFDLNAINDDIAIPDISNPRLYSKHAFSLAKYIQDIINDIDELAPNGPKEITLYGKLLSELMQARAYVIKEEKRYKTPFSASTDPSTKS